MPLFGVEQYTYQTLDHRNNRDKAARHYNISGLTKQIEFYEKSLTLVNDSDFYFMSSGDDSSETTPHIHRAGFQAIYGNTQKTVESFRDSYNWHFKRGRQYLDNPSNLESFIRSCPDFLSHTYNVVWTYQQLNAAKVEPDKALLGYGNVQKTDYPKLLEPYTSEKPEEFRETLRRYMPRWLWYPIAYPNLSENDSAKNTWTEFSTKDANFLIHPQEIEKGNAPLHMVLKQAKEVEKDDEDLAYRLKIAGLTTVLDAEKKLSEKDTLPEPPFFTLMLAGLINAKIPYSLKEKRFFNFEQAIGGTLQQTYSRAQLELSQGVEGDAVGFLNRLAAAYEDKFPQLIAKSLVDYGRVADDFNEVTLLRLFGNSEYSWMRRVGEFVESASNRKVLTTTEAVNLASNIQRIDLGDAKETLSENISTIVGEEDNYDFNKSLNKAGVKTNGVKIDAEIDIDKNVEYLNAQVTFSAGKQIRHVPFSLSFTGELESFEFESIDNSADGLQKVQETYSGLVAKAIQHEANIIREQQARKREKNKTKDEQDQTDEAERTAVLLPTMNRQQRLAYYKEVKETFSHSRKVKTRGVSEIPALYEKDETPPQQEESTSSAVEHLPEKLVLLGLEQERVASLLAEQKVTRVGPDDVIRRITNAAKTAEMNHSWFGKRVRTGKEVGVDLRQINWTLDSGSTPLRLYIEHTDKSTFTFQGIIFKRNHEQQQKFIDNLARKLKAQKEEQKRLKNVEAKYPSTKASDVIE